MDAVRNAVLECRSRSRNDDEFITNLGQLVQDHGSEVFQTYFHIFAGLELSPPLAEEHWREVLLHRRAISKALSRSIDLIPTIYDYLSITPHPLDNPRLIEEKEYTRVVRETTHDNLTGLFNRQYFDQALTQALHTAKRYNTDLSLLFLDIDNFKDVNDTYGHTCGDTVLQQVAGIIFAEKRDSDIAARYGGEEFVLVMPHTASINAYILAERIRRNIADTVIEVGGKQVRVTISGGLAAYPQNGDDSADLLRHADSALYLAKGAGKNIISMYKEEKRRYLRVKYEEPVKIKELGFDSSATFSGTSKDICIGGILFENTTALPIGARIQVSLPIRQDQPLLLIGTVVRVEAFARKQYDIGMAISFKEMEKIASDRIATFLKSPRPQRDSAA